MADGPVIAPREDTEARSVRTGDAKVSARNGNSSPNGRRLEPVLLCRAVEGSIEAVWASELGGSKTIERLACEADPTAVQRRASRSLVVALLGRSSYVMRELEIPRVSIGEAAQVLQLEIEATLPREYGDAEM